MHVESKFLVAPSHPLEGRFFTRRMEMLFVKPSTNGFAPVLHLMGSSTSTKHCAIPASRIGFFRLISRETGCIPAMRDMPRWLTPSTWHHSPALGVRSDNQQAAISDRQLTHACAWCRLS